MFAWWAGNESWWIHSSIIRILNYNGELDAILYCLQLFSFVRIRRFYGQCWICIIHKDSLQVVAWQNRYRRDSNHKSPSSNLITLSCVIFTPQAFLYIYYSIYRILIVSKQKYPLLIRSAYIASVCSLATCIEFKVAFSWQLSLLYRQKLFLPFWPTFWNNVLPGWILEK